MEDKKYLDGSGLARVRDWINSKFVKKDGNKVLTDNNYSDAEKLKLEGVEDNANHYELPISSGDTLGGIKIGSGFSIDEYGVASVDEASSVQWDNVENKPNTIEGYGITDAATKDELEEVKQEVSKTYHFKGTVATYDDLLLIEDPHEGDVYNVTDTGKNYCWVAPHDDVPGFWDDLGGDFDIEALSNDEIDTILGEAYTTEGLDKILKNGNEAELEADIALVSQYELTNDFVLDLNGHELSSEINKTLFVVEGSKLTIKGGDIVTAKRIAEAHDGGEIVIENGDYESGDVGFTASTGSKVTINGGTITAREGGVGAYKGSSIEINGGSIIGVDNFAVYTNGSNGFGENTIVINDGYFEGNIVSDGYEACGIYVANNDTFIMNGGTVIANGGAGLVMRAGTVVINDGYIEGKSSANRPAGSVGKVADAKINMQQCGVIYHESANYPGRAGMSLTINGGEIKGVVHSLEILSNEAEPQVTVNGGSFDPDFPEGGE